MSELNRPKTKTTLQTSSQCKRTCHIQMSSLLVMPFSVTVVAMVEMKAGKMYACFMTMGGGVGWKEEKAVALLCCVPSYNSSTASSMRRSFTFQKLYCKKNKKKKILSRRFL